MKTAGALMDALLPACKGQRIPRFLARNPRCIAPNSNLGVAGESTVDQSALTGESVPVPKTKGDEVFGGTMNEEGSLDVRVTRAAQESTLARLIRMGEETQGQKAQTQRLIDRLEQPYVIGVIGMTAAALGIPLAFGAACSLRAAPTWKPQPPCGPSRSTRRAPSRRRTPN
jgi:Cd2+/Zn2+-exporting ATPase